MSNLGKILTSTKSIIFMTVKPHSEQKQLQPSNIKTNSETEEEEKILCPHCQRTANNGIKCKGICVADSEY